MKSPSVLNYEIRPCKFAERKMLLASFARILGVFKQKYQYIGFGGLAFTDFKLFHKELNINSMFSIEEKYNINKLNFNKPFSCIEIKHGNSTAMLAEIDLTTPSIIWLDYDNVLSMTCFADIKILFDALPHGSIFVMSCNRQLRNDEADPIRPYTRDELNEKFINLVPDDIEDNCCTDINASQTIRRMLEAYCNKVIEDRNREGKDKLSFYPLYNIKYKEYRGARMFTYGGIILNSGYDIDKLNVFDFKFINTKDPYEISIPNITYREATELNKIMDSENDEQQMIDNNILTKPNIEKYKRIYKFIPNFYDVRL